MAKNNNPLMEDVDLTVSLALDDGTELECGVRQIFTAPNGKQYIAVTPMDQWRDDDCDVFLYGYVLNKEGESSIANIESDEEFEIALDALYERIDSDYFEELVPAEDEE